MSKSLLSTIAITGVMTIVATANAASPYISKVYEYRPAPGQFINTLPAYTEGDSYDDMLLKANEQLVGDKTPGLVCLGAFGGYVVFGFDHSVMNKSGEYDFKIYGNAFYSNVEAKAGSVEPGIVMVSRDDNGNGLPDDAWYELAGSEYTKESTIKQYGITYYRPSVNHQAEPDPDNKAITDLKYIRWTSDKGEIREGYVTRNTSHNQSYWPEWLDETELEFVGTKLADNYVDTSGTGMYYTQNVLDWGYADNYPNAEEPGLKIDWAVDANGAPMALDKIDFVRVHTGVNQSCGRLGETSTEIAGAEDLHPEYVSVGTVIAEKLILLLTAKRGEGIVVRSSVEATYCIYGMNGIYMRTGVLYPGDNYIEMTDLPSGIYVLRAGIHTIKVAI